MPGFSLAGWQNGLTDDRGQLTLKYICIDANGTETEGRSVFFWENVEGVLTDKTNAFGCFLAGLAGYDKPNVGMNNRLEEILLQNSMQ